MNDGRRAQALPTDATPHSHVADEQLPQPAIPTRDGIRLHWVLAVFAIPFLIPAPASTARVLLRSSMVTAAFVLTVTILLALGGAMGWLRPLGYDRTPVDWLTFCRDVGASLSFAVMVSGEDAEILRRVGGRVALVVLASALINLPFLSVGESYPRLLLRAGKLGCWSGTLVFCSLLVAVYCNMRWLHDHALHIDVVYVMVAMVFLAQITLWRMMPAYSGKPIGPGWRQRRSICWQCGYELRSLRVDGDCPDCGEPVRASLPEGREPTPWCAARWYVKPLGWLRTLPLAFRARPFSRRYECIRGFSAARTFALVTLFAPGLLFLVVGAMDAAHKLNLHIGGAFSWALFRTRYSEDYVAEAIVMVAASWLWLLFWGLVFTRGATYDTVRISNLLCYSTSWLWLTAVVGGAAWFLMPSVERAIPDTQITIPGLIEFQLPILGVIGLFVPAAALLLAHPLHVWRLVRMTRYVNA